MTHKPAEKLSRKEREREGHRREILEAAERVFVRKGYYLATVEQIAQEAQFAVGTIYNFFNGKEELYFQVLQKIAEDFMEIFEHQVLTRSDPEEAIGALIELRLTHFEEHRGYFRVFFETSPGSRLDPPRALPPNCVGLYDRYLGAVTGIFERGITDGLFDEMDPFYLALCLEGIVNAFVAYWSRSEPSEPLATRVDKMINAFLRWLRVGDPPAGKICREEG